MDRHAMRLLSVAGRIAAGDLRVAERHILRVDLVLLAGHQSLEEPPAGAHLAQLLLSLLRSTAAL